MGLPTLKTTFVILNFNGLEDTLRCLESIGRCSSPPTHTIVVDNASKLCPSATIEKEYPWCEVISNETNRGWAGGNNDGIRRALELGSDYVVLLNNDTIVSENIVERLCLAARTNEDFGILGPVIFHMERPEEVQTEGCLFNRHQTGGFFSAKPVPFSNSNEPTVVEVDIVNGCCMMIRADVFKKIGLIDERFFLIHEESDFCLRAQQAGYRCGVLGEGHVWHKQSVSFYRAGKRLQCYYDSRNLQLLLRKHLGKHVTGRRRSASWLDYWRTVYYRYCLEREHGEFDSAQAVIEGCYDGISRRFGPWRERKRLLSSPLRWIFEGLRQVKS